MREMACGAFGAPKLKIHFKGTSNFPRVGWQRPTSCFTRAHRVSAFRRPPLLQVPNHERTPVVRQVGASHVAA